MATETWKIENLDKMREYRRKWYANNSEHAKQKVREYRIVREREIALWVKSLKVKCSRCPESDPDCLDFHHLRDKQKAIATAIQSGWSKKKILAEIEKCIVLCANCHRKEHRKGK